MMNKWYWSHPRFNEPQESKRPDKEMMGEVESGMVIEGRPISMATGITGRGTSTGALRQRMRVTKERMGAERREKKELGGGGEGKGRYISIWAVVGALGGGALGAAVEV